MAAPRGVPTPAESTAPRRRRRSPRQLEESVQNRAAIVRSALELFATHGFTKTTLHAVADRVGLTRQGVLHHFGSKEGLFLEVIAESHRWSAHQSESGSTHGLDALRALTHFVGLSSDVHVRLALTLQAEAMHDGAPEHVVAYARSRLELIRNNIVERLREAQADGAIAAEVDVPAMATLISSAITGLQTQAVVDESAGTAAAFDQLIALLTR